MGNSALSALGFILGTLLNLYATVVAVRFVMQVVRADYYNPISQFIVTATGPLLKPLRQVVPSAGRYDTASLVLCFGVLLIKMLLFKALSLGLAPALGGGLPVDSMPLIAIVLATVVDMVYLFFNVFIYALVIQALLSWLPNAGASPVAGLLEAITSPVLAPVRRFVPPMGGLDLSVLVAIIGLYAARIFVVGSMSGLLLR